MAPPVGSALVVTISDRGFAGQTEDRSGPAVVNLLQHSGFEISGPELVPDNRERIIDILLGAAAEGYDLVVTTGGTGLGPRDITPQATAAILDYEVAGLAEQMRRAGLRKTPMAILSRGIAGVRDKTLILNLPGSPKGATESLEAVVPVLRHAIQLIHGDTAHE